MHAICRLRQVTFIPFINQRNFFVPIAYLHGTELMQFGNVTLQSTKSAESYFDQSKWKMFITMACGKVIEQLLSTF
jgi:hypothetical protein